MKLDSLKIYVRSVALFVIPRYPLCQALTLLLFIAEKVHDDSSPPFLPNAIYTYIGLMFVCSAGMGINSLKPIFSIVTSFLMFVSAGVMFFNKSLRYRNWVKVRISCGMIGVGAMFLFFAFFNSRKPRPQLLRRMAELSVSAYAAMLCYILIKSNEDKATFLHLVPLGQAALIIFVLMMGAVSFCYLLSIHVFDFNLVLCALCSFKLILMDIHLGYWHKRRGIDYWSQVRMIIDNAAFVLGCVFYSTCFKRTEYEQLKTD